MPIGSLWLKGKQIDIEALNKCTREQAEDFVGQINTKLAEDRGNKEWLM